MARPKKGDPEMLLVSFCDILTISISALFMAVIITVFEAVKIPVFMPTPRAIPTDRLAMFFECRENQVFYVDKAGLDSQVEKMLSRVEMGGVRPGDVAPFLKAIQAQEVGNPYYKVDPKYLLVGFMALEPRPDVRGDTASEVALPNSRFRTALAQLDPKKQYIAFLVRDDSFDIFRKAREVSDQAGFDSGWELLGSDEPIKFGAGGVAIAPQ